MVGVFLHFLTLTARIIALKLKGAVCRKIPEKKKLSGIIPSVFGLYS
jgi:hypothetical protein